VRRFAHPCSQAGRMGSCACALTFSDTSTSCTCSRVTTPTASSSPVPPPPTTTTTTAPTQPDEWVGLLLRSVVGVGTCDMLPPCPRNSPSRFSLSASFPSSFATEPSSEAISDTANWRASSANAWVSTCSAAHGGYPHPRKIRSHVIFTMVVRYGWNHVHTRNSCGRAVTNLLGVV
jgi:hypothetical protein